ncbi:hypothetical protein MMPV_003175 [Pyropia vietnamensis]
MPNPPLLPPVLRPSHLETGAAAELGALPHPALSFLLRALATRVPATAASRAVGWVDEVVTAVVAAADGLALVQSGGTWAEGLVGLRREEWDGRTGVGMGGRLSAAGILRGLLQSAGVPYLLRKADAAHARLGLVGGGTWLPRLLVRAVGTSLWRALRGSRGGPIRGTPSSADGATPTADVDDPWPPLRTAAVRAFVAAYPAVVAVASLASTATAAAYAVGVGDAPSLGWALPGSPTLRRRVPADPPLSRVVGALAVAAALAFRAAEVGLAALDRAAAEVGGGGGGGLGGGGEELPPPPPPLKVRASSPSGGARRGGDGGGNCDGRRSRRGFLLPGECGVCGRRDSDVVAPTVLVVSGVVCCYGCAASIADAVCPLTGMPVGGATGLRRLYLDGGR